MCALRQYDLHYIAFCVELKRNTQYISQMLRFRLARPRRFLRWRPDLARTINILIGTMTGTAELVAEEMQGAIEESGDWQVELLDMDGLDGSVFERPGVFLICTSTYGQGDVPDNALDLYEGMSQSRPDLSHVQFGVFGLGDSTYADTYNDGGRLFEKLLAELGASMLGARAEQNASGPTLPEDEGAEWVKDWLELLPGGESAAA